MMMLKMMMLKKKKMMTLVMVMVMMLMMIAIMDRAVICLLVLCNSQKLNLSPYSFPRSQPQSRWTP